MNDLLGALQIVLYILAGYSAIAILHVPFFWLTAKTVWDERREEAKRIIAHCVRNGFPNQSDDPRWTEAAWAIAMDDWYDLNADCPPLRFRRESALVQSIGWPISDACWLAHWLNGVRRWDA